MYGRLQSHLDTRQPYPDLAHNRPGASNSHGTAGPDGKNLYHPFEHGFLLHSWFSALDLILRSRSCLHKVIISVNRDVVFFHPSRNIARDHQAAAGTLRGTQLVPAEAAAIFPANAAPADLALAIDLLHFVGRSLIFPDSCRSQGQRVHLPYPEISLVYRSRSPTATPRSPRKPVRRPIHLSSLTPNHQLATA